MSLGFFRLFQRRHAAGWTLAAGLAVTAAVGWEMHREAVAMDRQRLALRVSELQSQLDFRLEKSEMLLQHLRDYLTLSGENRNPVFALWCYENGLTINCPWILGIAVATNRHMTDLRATLPNPPANWTKADWETLNELKNHQRIGCEPALRSNVTNGTRFLPDYDLQCAYSDRGIPGTLLFSKRHWLATAVLAGRLGMSDRRSVMLDANRREIIGTLFYVPIYQRGLADYLAAPAPLSHYHRCARWMHLSAVIVAPVDFRRLVESVRDGAPADLGIELFSSTNVLSADTWLNLSEGGPLAADPAFQPYLTHRQTWPMYGMRFSIFFYTTPLFEAQSPRRLAKIAMAAGTVLTLLATGLVGVVQRARNQQELLTDQIREARDALAAAQKERSKISRDLHDGTIQSLYAIQLGLERTAGRHAAEPAAAGRELWAVRQELDAVIAEIRQFITAETKMEGAVDFRAVLQSVAQRAGAGTATRIELDCDAAAARGLAAEHAVQLANIVREALSNSLRHARAGAIRLSLRGEEDAAVLEIVDDGCGFDPQAQARVGLGLSSMASRATEMGGKFALRSAPGAGTHIEVRVPRQAGTDGDADPSPPVGEPA
jgi:signal transduction histidine kinase